MKLVKTSYFEIALFSMGLNLSQVSTFICNHMSRYIYTLTRLMFIGGIIIVWVVEASGGGYAKSRVAMRSFV